MGARAPPAMLGDRLPARVAGPILLGWLATQVAMLGYVSWMQPAFAALALVIIALGRRLPR
jgi:hypothetical protein